jgi:hypothetical protein
VPAATLPALPQAYVDSTLPASSSACTVNVAATDDLQAAIDGANLGDTLCLQTGANIDEVDRATSTALYGSAATTRSRLQSR